MGENMDRNRTFKLALLAGAAVTLQGCVAAVVPLAASGLMGGSQVARDSADDPDQVVSAPANDPSVTVERSTEQTALAVVPVEPVTNPGPAAPAVPESLATPEPALAVAGEEETDPVASMTTPFALGTESASVGTVEPEPITPPPSPVDEVPSEEATESFAEAMAPVLVAGTLEPVDEPAPASTVQPDPVREPSENLAASSAPEPAPQSVSDESSAVRIIAVDSQVALADTSSASTRVSAAEAAAALANIEAASQPEPAPVSLARTARERAPAAPAPPPPVSAPATRLAMAEPAPAAAPARTPPPAPAPTRPAPQPLATGEFASLINYATRQQSRSAEDRASALLADRASLMPDRAACGGAEPTVLIDLDPGDEKFDPTNVPRAATGLSSALAQLRARGVKVAWISSNAQGQVLAIREALNRSGLDLDNSDQLLLMRYPEDRKQTRREDLAQSACVVAIAGDERTDFDELFEYLLNPQAAATLDPLMGNGWFLIPQPLTTERPTP